jgi:hypothetical protein
MRKKAASSAWECRQAVNVFLGRVERHPQDGKLGVRTRALRWAARQTGIPYRVFYRIAEALNLDAHVEPFTVRSGEPIPKTTQYRWLFPEAIAFDARSMRREVMALLLEAKPASDHGETR